MGWPQIAMLILYALNLLLGAYMHGKPKKGNESFISNVIGVLISFGILYAGGFWNN